MLSDLFKLSRKEKYVVESVFIALCFIILAVWLLTADAAELCRRDKLLYVLSSCTVFGLFELFEYIGYRRDTKKHNDFILYGRKYPSEEEQLRALTIEKIAELRHFDNDSFEDFAEMYNDEPEDYSFIVGLTKFAGVCRRSDPEEWYAMLSAGDSMREFIVLSLKFFALHSEAIRFQKLCKLLTATLSPSANTSALNPTSSSTP